MPKCQVPKVSKVPKYDDEMEDLLVRVIAKRILKNPDKPMEQIIN